MLFFKEQNVCWHVCIHTHIPSSLSGLTRAQLHAESCVCCSGQGLKNTNNWAAGKSPEARCNDDKAKGQFFRALKCLQSFTHRSLCAYFLSIYRVYDSCTLGDAKIRYFFCAPAGQFQQHCHSWHFSWLCWTGKLRGSTCRLLNGPQHLRGATALGVPPRLLPQLRERQVRVSLQMSVSIQKCIWTGGTWRAQLFNWNKLNWKAELEL